jgi:hypothetical protein
MSHSDAVTDGDGVELEGCAAGLSDGVFDEFCDFVEVDVSGDDLAEAVGDSDEWAFDIVVGESAGAEQGPVRGSLETFFYRVASHFFPFLVRGWNQLSADIGVTMAILASSGVVTKRKPLS